MRTKAVHFGDSSSVMLVFSAGEKEPRLSLQQIPVVHHDANKRVSDEVGALKSGA